MKTLTDPNSHWLIRAVSEAGFRRMLVIFHDNMSDTWDTGVSEFISRSQVCQNHKLQIVFRFLSTVG